VNLPARYWLYIIGLGLLVFVLVLEGGKSVG
jgi:hypothetical protein